MINIFILLSLFFFSSQFLHGMDNLPASYWPSSSSRDYARMHFQRIIQDENNKSQDVSHTYYDCPLANLTRANLEQEIQSINEMLHQNAEQLASNGGRRTSNSFISNLYVVDVNYEEEKITLVLNKMGIGAQNLPQRNPIAYFHMSAASRADVNDRSANSQFNLRFEEIKRRIKSCANITSPQTPASFTQKLTQEVIHDLIPSREIINSAIGQEIGRFLFIKLGLVPILQKINESPMEKEYSDLIQEIGPNIQLLAKLKELKKASKLLTHLENDRDQTIDKNAIEHAENSYLEYLEQTLHSLAGTPS